MNIDLFIAECDLIKFMENNIDKIEVFYDYATLNDLTINNSSDNVYIENIIIDSPYNQERLNKIFRPMFDKQTIDNIYATINPHLKQQVITNNLTEEVE